MDKKLVFIFWILFIGIYSVNLTLLPLFEDEAEYLFLAEAIKQNFLGSFFIYPQYGLFPLFGWLVALLNFFITDSLVAGRMVNIFLASSLIWWIWAIGQLYKLPKQFFLAAFILLITSPILLLNARVALLDTAVLVFTAWYLYFALKIFINPTKKDYIGLFIAMLAALLTKATVLFGIPAVLIFVFLESYQKRLINKNVVWLILVSGFAFIISGGLFLSFRQQISSDSGSSILQYFTMESLFKRIRLNSWLTFHWATIYYQPALIALLEYIVFFKKIKHKKLYLMLGLWVIAAMGVTITLNRFYYPRHILILVAPIIIFVAGILAFIPKKIGIPLFILIILPRLFFDWTIISAPQKADLAFEDKLSFYEDYTSGIGIRDLATSLDSLSKEHKIVVWLDGSYVLQYGLPRELRYNQNIIFKSFNPFLGSFFKSSGVVVKDDNVPTYAIVNRWYPSNVKKLKLIKSFPVSFRHTRYLYQAI